MAKTVRKPPKTAGLPPGTLVHVGERKTEQVRITYIDYDESNFQEKQILDISECFQFKTTPTVTWINIDGIHQIDIMEKLGKQFELHPLILEDEVEHAAAAKIRGF